MALTDEARGPQAAWLYGHMKARFGRGDGALQALADALEGRGARREPDTIKGWIASEERSPIPPEILPHLEAIFDDPAPARRRPVTSADLVAALAAQTEAVNALVAALGPLLEERESIEVRLRTLEARTSPRTRSGGAASRGRSAPRATVG